MKIWLLALLWRAGSKHCGIYHCFKNYKSWLLIGTMWGFWGVLFVFFVIFYLCAASDKKQNPVWFCSLGILFGFQKVTQHCFLPSLVPSALLSLYVDHFACWHKQIISWDWDGFKANLEKLVRPCLFLSVEYSLSMHNTLSLISAITAKQVNSAQFLFCECMVHCW